MIEQALPHFQVDVYIRAKDMLGRIGRVEGIYRCLPGLNDTVAFHDAFTADLDIGCGNLARLHNQFFATLSAYVYDHAPTFSLRVLWATQLQPTGDLLQWFAPLR